MIRLNSFFLVVNDFNLLTFDVVTFTLYLKGGNVMYKNKLDALRDSNALNPKPETVKDDLFHQSSFFDSNDLIQVKYEMLRRHLQEKKSVASAALAFGFSRVTFYEAKDSFEKEGIIGLVPKQRGPKEGHKLTPPILEFALEKMKQDPTLATETVLRLIKDQFDITIHQRTLERGIERKKKAGNRSIKK